MEIPCPSWFFFFKIILLKWTWFKNCYLLRTKVYKNTYTQIVTIRTADAGFLERRFICIKVCGVRFADFISFFLNIQWKWNNLVSLRPNHFIFIGYLKMGGGWEGVQANILNPLWNCHWWTLDFLMHLQMQRDVWLDNFINLRQYILRYTVANLTSLLNAPFHWLKSEYMQLARGFMQLAAAGRWCHILHFHSQSYVKMLLVH